MKFQDWQIIDYETALQKQLEINAQVHSGQCDETVVFCTHPPVVTLGRKALPDEVSGWDGAVVEISRGGRATYHGPNQIVIYPILDLRQEHETFAVRDIHGYLRALEKAVIETLGEWGIQAQSGDQFPKNEDKSYTGVWVGSKKLASIGIGVRKWITYHGVAINVVHDSSAFQGIQPCGFQPQVMASVEEVLGKSVDRMAFQNSLRARLENL